jgi:formylmethanofuran dehydrogenase subunit B
MDTETTDATCPFCGLACDDLRVTVGPGELAVSANGCDISKPAFASLSLAGRGALQPRAAGTPVDPDAAIARCTEILRHAAQPVFAGLGTDVSGIRAVMRLADQCGAVIGHMHSGAQLRNTLVLQDSGWITTTLTEVRNRADLIIFAGTDVVSRFPRFFERFVWNRDTLFRGAPAQRELVYLGEAKNIAPGVAPDGAKPTLIACANRDLGQVASALRCLLADRDLQANAAGGVPLADLRPLSERMRRAKYGVIVWAASDLDHPHAELTVQGLVELVRALNRTTRFAGLPLGGSEGDLTAAQVHTWQTGFALPSSLAGGAPDYDPYHYSLEHVLARHEADALLWISSIGENHAPPPAAVPTIVLGRLGMAFAREPDVYIPVATPGVDHAGHFFRADQVVALPLRKLREIGLPSVATTVERIAGALAAGRA